MNHTAATAFALPCATLHWSHCLGATPIILFLCSLDFNPWRGLGNKSATISSVGQCLMLTVLLFTLSSVMKKRQTSVCLVLSELGASLFALSQTAHVSPSKHGSINPRESLSACLSGDKAFKCDAACGVTGKCGHQMQGNAACPERWKTEV